VFSQLHENNTKNTGYLRTLVRVAVKQEYKADICTQILEEWATLTYCEPPGVLPDASGSHRYSENERTIQVKNRFRADMFNLCLPILAKIIEAQTVLLWID